MKRLKVFACFSILVPALAGLHRTPGGRADGRDRTHADLADEHTIALRLFDETSYPCTILTDAGPRRNDLMRGGIRRRLEKPNP